MQYLVGQCFSLTDVSYRIVDVRNVGGESMVYAEKLIDAADYQRHMLRRAAFHYSDIAEFISSEKASWPI